MGYKTKDRAKRRVSWFPAEHRMSPEINAALLKIARSYRALYGKGPCAPTSYIVERHANAIEVCYYVVIYDHPPGFIYDRWLGIAGSYSIDRATGQSRFYAKSRDVLARLAA
jgi:hypothetical protein